MKSEWWDYKVKDTWYRCERTIIMVKMESAGSKRHEIAREFGISSTRVSQMIGLHERRVERHERFMKFARKMERYARLRQDISLEELFNSVDFASLPMLNRGINRLARSGIRTFLDFNQIPDEEMIDFKNMNITLISEVKFFQRKIADYLASFRDNKEIFNVELVVDNQLDWAERKVSMVRLASMGYKYDDIAEAFGTTSQRVGHVIREVNREQSHGENSFLQRLGRGEVDVRKENLFDVKLSDLSLSCRTSNCMKHEGLETVWDLDRVKDKDILRTPNFGRKSLNELRNTISDLKEEWHQQALKLTVGEQVAAGRVLRPILDNVT